MGKQVVYGFNPSSVLPADRGSVRTTVERGGNPDQSVETRPNVSNCRSSQHSKNFGRASSIVADYVCCKMITVNMCTV